MGNRRSVAVAGVGSSLHHGCSWSARRSSVVGVGVVGVDGERIAGAGHLTNAGQPIGCQSAVANNRTVVAAMGSAASNCSTDCIERSVKGKCWELLTEVVRTRTKEHLIG